MEYEEYEWQLEPGSKLFVYTDGVPEANTDRAQLFGTDRLLQTLDAVRDGTPQEIIRAVDLALTRYVGDAPQFDDVTMLCVHYIGDKGAKKVDTGKEYRTIASISNLTGVTDFVNGELAALNCPNRTRIQLDVAVDEIFTNIASYAYEGEPGPVSVFFSAQEEAGTVTLRFADRGKPFDPLQAPEPDLTLDPEDRPEGGLGIFMVRRTMNEVSYEYRDGQNILTLIKKL